MAYLTQSSKSRVPYRVAVAIDKNRKRQGFEQLGGEKRPKRDEKNKKMRKKTYWILKILKSGVNQNPPMLFKRIKYKCEQ